jgi:hypothetical protein
MTKQEPCQPKISVHNRAVCTVLPRDALVLLYK